MSMIPLIVSQSFLWAAASALLVIAPETILSWFDMPQSPSQHALARVFGAELSGLTLVSYFTRHLVYTPRKKSLALAYAVCNSLGFAVTSGAIIQGSMARFTWALSGLYLIYALAFAYYRFFDHREHEQRTEGAGGLFR
jgi:hypothetical protein